MADVRSRYMELIAGRRSGPLFDLARGALTLLSIPYYCGVGLRNLYYDLHKRAVVRVSCPVISVGNITVGGTGKTPLAALIANRLADRDRSPALLLRGYKGRPIQFDPDNRDQAARRWRMESDEALVLKQRCPRAKVIINPDRVAGARRAVADHADVLVLDDGFQHRRLGRDLDIVLVDATVPFGHGHMLPRGLLREPTRSLRRADLIILTRSDQIDETARGLLIRRLRRLSADTPVISAVHRIVGFMDLKGRPVAVEDPSAAAAVIFAGIAHFESFRRCVQDLGIRVLAAYEYPDHHDYTAREITGLADTATALEANAILTTQKDAVKLVGRWEDKGCRLLSLNLEVEFDADGDKILDGAITECGVRNAEC